MTFQTIDERLKYLESLLTNEDWNNLLRLKNEWYECGSYESDEEIIEENFEIQIPYKGYDLLYKKFYCVVLYIFHMPEYSVNLGKFISFENLKDYIDFFDKDMYNNASYLGYNFTEDDIHTYSIDIQKISNESFYKKIYHDERSTELVKSIVLLHWARVERHKVALVSLCKSFLKYNSYEEIITSYPDMNDGDFLLAAQYAATRNPNKTYDILDTYPGYLSYDLENYAKYYYKDPDIYNKYSKRNMLFEYFQCIDNLSASSITKDTVFEIYTRLGFDKDTNMFYKEYHASYDGHIGLMFKELFLDIDEMAHALNNDLRNADFSHCHYDIDWSKYNVENSQFTSGPIKRVIHVKLHNNKFECKMKFMQGNAEITSNSHSFLCSRDVIHYLDYDTDIDKINEFCAEILNSNEYIIDIG